MGRSRRRGSLTYYRDDLALVHHLGFGFHADATAPGILALLEPVRGGLVLELGCGSGLFTRYLVEAGHRVVATDASPAMLALARNTTPGADGTAARSPRRPSARCPTRSSRSATSSATSSDEAAVDRALAAAADALRPGGVLALDLCDLRLRRDACTTNRTRASLIADDSAIVTRFSLTEAEPLRPRNRSAFLGSEDGTWRRDDERHENVLVDTACLLPRAWSPSPESESFGDEDLPDGLVAIVGRKADG